MEKYVKERGILYGKSSGNEPCSAAGRRGI